MNPHDQGAHPSSGDGAFVQNNESGTDPATRAYIHMLRGLGLQYSEIAAQTDIDQHIIKSEVHRTRQCVCDDGQDPVDVYADVLAPIHLLEPHDSGGDE